MEQGSFASLLNMEWNRDGRRFTVHLRCGICCVKDDGLPVSKVIERAIIAKTCAGRGGMSLSPVFEESMLRSYISHADITARFRNSLRRGDFKVYYQPIVRAQDGAVCSAEALVRWEHPTMGTIAPGAFVPVLERDNQISMLDRYVLHQVHTLQESLAHYSFPQHPCWDARVGWLP